MGHYFQNVCTNLKKFFEIKVIISNEIEKLQYLTAITTDTFQKYKFCEETHKLKTLRILMNKIWSQIKIPDCRIDYFVTSNDSKSPIIQCVFSRYSVDDSSPEKKGYRVYVYLIIDIDNQLVMIRYRNRAGKIVKNDSFAIPLFSKKEFHKYQYGDQYRLYRELDSAFIAMNIDTKGYVIEDKPFKKKKYKGSTSSGPSLPITIDPTKNTKPEVVKGDPIHDE